MQYMEVYSSGNLYARMPLGEYDLMQIQSGNWEADALERARLLEMLLGFFKEEPLIRDLKLKKITYQLIIESRMNDKRFKNAINILSTEK